jgi:hypothetical protein
VTESTLLALIAMIGSLGTAAIAAYVAVRVGKVETKVNETHELVNGVSHALATAQQDVARAEGVVAGTATERDRPRDVPTGGVAPNPFAGLESQQGEPRGPND